MADKVHPNRKITKEEISFLINSTTSEISLDFLESIFAYTANGEPKFQPNDYFILSKGVFFNDQDIRTTVGRFIFNRLILTPKLGKLIGYINESMNGGNIGKLDQKMTNLLLEDKITVSEFAEYIDKMQWLGFSITKFISPSMTSSLIIPPKRLKDHKKELIEENKDKIENADINTVNKIEKDLLDIAKDELKGISDMDIYDSGARGSFGNNYKQTAVARGIVKPLANPDQLKASMTSLEEGIKPEDIPIFADVLTSASYSRAVGTRTGGYEGKKLSASFQNVVLDSKDSDCGTKHCEHITLTNSNKGLLLNRYIIDNGKKVLLTEDNNSKYVGKEIALRSPMFCQGEKICNVCAGELYYQMGIENIGLISNIIGSSITTLALKQ